MNPYVIIGLIAAWIASLVGVGFWQNDAGHVAERTEWQTRENGELRTANATIKALQEQARKDEQTHAAALAAVSTDYERKLSDANKQRAADAAALRAGTLRLRDPNLTGLRACGGLGTQVGAGAGRRDGPEGGELSEAAAGFLLEFASDADDVARQLTACQAVVVKDRELR
jgi:hypothetical protein